MVELESFEVFQKHGETKSIWNDPYIIAVGIVDGSTVVTNESADKHPERKFPYVCENRRCVVF